jgi:serine/threonine-protein kinase
MHDEVMPVAPPEYSALATALAGRYRIERELGHGGMATVFLAHDLKHDRKVALKVLKPDLAAVVGAERFLAEIKTTANLQHPNILALFDSGQVDGTVFYAMPFVDGESLRDRLAREKQLPVDTALRIATEVADALHYAHRRGVIHRDIKPENVMLHEGRPMVMDFGIALAASNTAGSRITETGMSLGTPTYMSPEQAIGDRAIDGRSDVYSLAATTYEMLAGDPPYVAGTAQAIIAKVLTEKAPSVRAARPNVPAHVDAALARALEKLPADRFASAQEFSEALAGRGPISLATTTAPGPGIASPPASQRAWMMATIAFALIAVAATVLAVRERRSLVAEADAPVVRSRFDLAPNQRIHDALPGSTIAVSPAGDAIAYTSISARGFETFMRRSNELTPRQLIDVNNEPVAGRNLAFSPDGKWLALTEGNVLKRVATDRGPVTTIASLKTAVPYGLAWVGDSLLVGGFSGMEIVSVTGGGSTLVSAGDSTSPRLGQRWPVVMPDQRHVVVSSSNSAAEVPHLAVLDLRTRTVVYHDLIAAVPLAFLEGQLAYVSTAGTVMAVPFDATSQRPTGDPVQIEDEVVMDPTGGSKISISASGTLMYLKGRAEYQPLLMSGASATPLTSELHLYSAPRFSPDGKRLAIGILGGRSSEISVYDLQHNTFTQITSDGPNVRPEWTPDGKRIVFISSRGGRQSIWWQPADGSGPPEKLYDPPVEPFEALVSPDSKWLVFRTAPGSMYPRDILAVPLEGEKKIVPIVATPASDQMPRISPDGKWIAYQTNESGRFDVYVRPFPGNGARTPVSTNGGTEPVWSRDGTALYYLNALGQIVETKVTTGATLSIGARRVVVTADQLTDASHANYDVSPDGKFLILKRAGAESQPIIVRNWVRELREKTARTR